ncbi:hypothetical protein [Lysobacter sp. F6437]|uniref:hypothetical protein n=1 Tax=Lysobacter sp. F6437 TaxID=3459296 RepID=UPI00403D8240
MKIRLEHSLPALLVICAWTPAIAADAHHGGGHGNATGLVQTVREATHRYLHLSRAEADGYGAFLGCTSGHQHGAMGLHYANGVLVSDGTLDANRPEVLVYEPRRNGRMQLVAVEYLVIAEAWDAANASPPVLQGQLFHYQGSPNRYGLPAFYGLHVWAWKHNPSGMYSSWNPRVSCESYDPPLT